MPSNLQITIKNNKRELRNSTKNFKLTLTNDPKKFYNEVPKPLR